MHGRKNIFNIFLTCVLTLSLVGVAFARYSKSAMLSAVYSNVKTSSSTMDTVSRIYDFGCYVTGDDTSFDTTLCIENESALSGTLSFTWDSETASRQDIAVLVEGLSPDKNGNYSVNEEDGVLTLPFSAIISATSRSGVAYLDVAWTPQGAQSATLFSRYLIALNPYNENGRNVQINGNSTGFLTSSLMAVSAVASDDLLISRGSGLTTEFSAATVYYTADYPQGVTLINDSLIYLPVSEDGTVDTVINFGKPVTEDVSITVGTHTLNCVATTHSPQKTNIPLSVTADIQPAIVSAATPLSVTVTQAKPLEDAIWNDTQTNGAQLNWQIQRLKNGKYIELENDHNLQISTDGKKITLAAPNADQPAGTYRLVFWQTYNGYNISTVEQVFFIDYR